MNRDDFNLLASNPLESTLFDASGLNDLITEYPYLQAAHLLLLYNLKRFSNEKFDLQLRESSLVISDRRILFDMINKVNALKDNSKTEVTNNEETDATQVVFNNNEETGFTRPVHDVEEKKLPQPANNVEENTITSKTEVKEIEFQLEEGNQVEKINDTYNVDNNPSGESSTVGLLEIDDTPSLVDLKIEQKQETSYKEPELISKFLE